LAKDTKDEILVTLFRDNMARFVFHQIAALGAT